MANALAAREKEGTIIIDRNAVKRLPVVNNLAAQLASNDVAPVLRGKRIVKIDLSSIFGDSQNAAEISVWLDAALKQIEATGGRTILFIEDVNGFGGDNPLYGDVVASRLRRLIADGKMQIVSASTDEEFNSQIALDRQLNARFKKVNLDALEDLTDDQAVIEKLSPDLAELMASGDPNQKVKVILQSDDIKNSQLTATAKRINVLLGTSKKSIKKQIR